MVENFKSVWFVKLQKYFSYKSWKVTIETEYGLPAVIWMNNSSIFASDPSRQPIINQIWNDTHHSPVRVVSKWCSELFFSLFTEALCSILNKFNYKSPDKQHLNFIFKQKSDSRCVIYYPLTPEETHGQRKLVFYYLKRNNAIQVQEKRINSTTSSDLLATFWFKNIPGADFEQKVNLLLFGPPLSEIYPYFKEN